MSRRGEAIAYLLPFCQLAVDLDYFDQAHFIKDFNKIIGVSPGEYARRASHSENV